MRALGSIGVPGEPAAVAALQMDRHAEAGGDGLRRQRLLDRSRGVHAAAPQQQRVGEPARNLLQVVGHQHGGGRPGIGGHGAQQRHELLAAAQIESRRRLVEQPQRRVVHQRAGQQDALALAGRQRAEAGPGQRGASEALEQLARARPVGGRVLVPPRRQGGVLAGDDDVLDPQRGPQHVRQRRAGDAQSPPQLTDVGTAQPLAEDLDGAAGGMDVQAGEPAQRGLPRSVRSQHGPALAAPHAPVDAPQNRALAADQIDAGQGQHEVVTHPAALYRRHAAASGRATTTIVAGQWGPRKRTPGVRGAAPSELRIAACGACATGRPRRES